MVELEESHNQVAASSGVSPALSHLMDYWMDYFVLSTNDVILTEERNMHFILKAWLSRTKANVRKRANPKENE